jgi:hypothetical protein
MKTGIWTVNSLFSFLNKINMVSIKTQQKSKSLLAHNKNQDKPSGTGCNGNWFLLQPTPEAVVKPSPCVAIVIEIVWSFCIWCQKADSPHLRTLRDSGL